MKRERFKTVLLVFLVLLSATLSWRILNYRPAYEKAPLTAAAIETNVQMKLTPEAIIQPQFVTLHTSETDYLSYDPALLANSIADFEKMKLEVVHSNSFKKTNGSTLLEEINSFLESKNLGTNTDKLPLVSTDTIIYTFPGNVPFSLFSSFMHLNDTGIINFTFDKIIIPTKSESRAIFFVSQDEFYVEASVDPSVVEVFRENYFSSKESFKKAVSVTIGENRQIYVPADPFVVPSKKYIKNTLDISGFVKALFPNPNDVHKEFRANDESISDGASLISIFYDTSTFSYVKPTLNDTKSPNQETKLLNNIDFINSHAGWAPGYRYASKNNSKNHSIFRLYEGGFPVFSTANKSEILVSSNPENIKFYKRPYFALDVAVDESVNVTLPTGAEVLAKLSLEPDFDIKNVDDLVIGYSMEFDPVNKNVVNLDPCWYLYFKGSWVKIE